MDYIFVGVIAAAGLMFLLTVFYTKGYEDGYRAGEFWQDFYDHWEV